MVGSIRLKLVELVLACLRAEEDALNKAVFESSVLSTITDMFFGYEWNTQLQVLFE
jgi:hypothetical protein